MASTTTSDRISAALERCLNGAGEGQSGSEAVFAPVASSFVWEVLPELRKRGLA